MRPYLIERRCPAVQDLCKAIAACSAGAISYIEDEQAPLGGRIVFDHAKCQGCGTCAADCCGQAIEMR